jgi:peptidoglycan/xylan/chitin deacetylase (PgdA/CDA1 family)
LRRIDYRLVGWGWMLWDVNPFGPRTAGTILDRLIPRISSGDIVVMHDGDDAAPEKPQPQAVAATAQLIPALRARGFTFGSICPDTDAASTE